MQVTHIRHNYMGTVSFNAKFAGMRKEQDFIVYPNPSPDKIMIQSDTRCGIIDNTGKVTFGNCKYFIQLHTCKSVSDKIENIEQLLQAIRRSASPNAGNNGMIYCDNSTAGGV